MPFLLLSLYFKSKVKLIDLSTQVVYLLIEVDTRLLVLFKLLYYVFYQLLVLCGVLEGQSQVRLHLESALVSLVDLIGTNDYQDSVEQEYLREVLDTFAKGRVRW